MEFTINNRQYRTCKLDAFKQLHVARRILPLVAKLPEMLGLTLEDCLNKSGEIGTSLTGNLSSIKLDVIANTLAELKDEDVDYVFTTCQEAVEVRDEGGTGWGKIRVNGQLMYTFVGLPESIGMVVNVIKDNLGDFFSGSAPASPSKPGKRSGAITMPSQAEKAT